MDPDGLRIQDRVAVLRLAGECCELGSDPYSWHLHLFDGLRALIGFQIATAGMCNAPLARMSVKNFRGMLDVGWSDPKHREHCSGFWMSNGFCKDPIYRAQVRMRGAVVCSRPQDVVSDAAWRNSRPLNEYYRVAEQEEMMCGVLSPPPESGVPLAFLNLLRPRSDPRFSERDRDVLAAILAALRPRVGLRLMPFGNSSPPGITPRTRQVMAMLLRGNTEKEIAATLGLAAGTVHDYVKHLYATLGVHSRTELLPILRSLLLPRAPAFAPPFNGRLHEVLDRLTQGRSERDIARELAISPYTVHDYVKALYRRFGVHGRAQLVFACLLWKDADSTEGRLPAPPPSAKNPTGH